MLPLRSEKSNEMYTPSISKAMTEKIIVLCSCILIMQWNVLIPAEDYNTYVNCPTVHTAVHCDMIGLLHHNEPNTMCQYIDVNEEVFALNNCQYKTKGC